MLTGELEALPPGQLEALPALQTMGPVLTSEEIEAEWQEGAGGLPAENPGKSDTVAALHVHFYTWEDAAEFEKRLGMEAGAVKRKQGRPFIHWPKTRDVRGTGSWVL